MRLRLTHIRRLVNRYRAGQVLCLVLAVSLILTSVPVEALQPHTDGAFASISLSGFEPRITSQAITPYSFWSLWHGVLPETLRPLRLAAARSLFHGAPVFLLIPLSMGVLNSLSDAGILLLLLTSSAGIFLLDQRLRNQFYASQEGLPFQGELLVGKRMFSSQTWRLPVLRAHRDFNRRQSAWQLSYIVACMFIWIGHVVPTNSLSLVIALAWAGVISVMGRSIRIQKVNPEAVPDKSDPSEGERELPTMHAAIELAKCLFELETAGYPTSKAAWKNLDTLAENVIKSAQVLADGIPSRANHGETLLPDHIWREVRDALQRRKIDGFSLATKRMAEHLNHDILLPYLGVWIIPKKKMGDTLQMMVERPLFNKAITIDNRTIRVVLSRNIEGTAMIKTATNILQINYDFIREDVANLLVAAKRYPESSVISEDSMVELRLRDILIEEIGHALDDSSIAAVEGDGKDVRERIRPGSELAIWLETNTAPDTLRRDVCELAAALRKIQLAHVKMAAWAPIAQASNYMNVNSSAGGPYAFRIKDYDLRDRFITELLLKKFNLNHLLVFPRSEKDRPIDPILKEIEARKRARLTLMDQFEALPLKEMRRMGEQLMDGNLLLSKGVGILPSATADYEEIVDPPEFKELLHGLLQYFQLKDNSETRRYASALAFETTASAAWEFIQTGLAWGWLDAEDWPKKRQVIWGQIGMWGEMISGGLLAVAVICGVVDPKLAFGLGASYGILAHWPFVGLRLIKGQYRVTWGDVLVPPVIFLLYGFVAWGTAEYDPIEIINLVLPWLVHYLFDRKQFSREFSSASDGGVRQNFMALWNFVREPRAFFARRREAKEKFRQESDALIDQLETKMKTETALAIQEHKLLLKSRELTATQAIRLGKVLLADPEDTGELGFEMAWHHLSQVKTSDVVSELIKLLEIPLARRGVAYIFSRYSTQTPYDALTVAKYLENAKILSSPESVLPDQRHNRPHVGVIVVDDDYRPAENGSLFSKESHGAEVLKVVQSRLAPSAGISMYGARSSDANSMNDIEAIVKAHPDQTFVIQCSFEQKLGFHNPTFVGSQFEPEWVKHMGREYGAIFVLAMGDTPGLFFKMHPPLDNVLYIAESDDFRMKTSHSAFALPGYVFGASVTPSWSYAGTGFAAPMISGLLARWLTEESALSPKSAVEKMGAIAEPMKNDWYYMHGFLGKGLIPDIVSPDFAPPEQEAPTKNKMILAYRWFMNHRVFGHPAFGVGAISILFASPFVIFAEFFGVPTATWKSAGGFYEVLQLLVPLSVIEVLTVTSAAAWSWLTIRNPAEMKFTTRNLGLPTTLALSLLGLFCAGLSFHMGQSSHSEFESLAMTGIGVLFIVLSGIGIVLGGFPRLSARNMKRYGLLVVVLTAIACIPVALMHSVFVDVIYLINKNIAEGKSDVSLKGVVHFLTVYAVLFPVALYIIAMGLGSRDDKTPRGFRAGSIWNKLGITVATIGLAAVLSLPQAGIHEWGHWDMYQPLFVPQGGTIDWTFLTGKFKPPIEEPTLSALADALSFTRVQAEALLSAAGTFAAWGYGASLGLMSLWLKRYSIVSRSFQLASLGTTMYALHYLVTSHISGFPINPADFTDWQHLWKLALHSFTDPLVFLSVLIPWGIFFLRGLAEIRQWPYEPDTTPIRKNVIQQKLTSLGTWLLRPLPMMTLIAVLWSVNIWALSFDHEGALFMAGLVAMVPNFWLLLLNLQKVHVVYKHARSRLQRAG